MRDCLSDATVVAWQDSQPTNFCAARRACAFEVEQYLRHIGAVYSAVIVEVTLQNASRVQQERIVFAIAPRWTDDESPIRGDASAEEELFSLLKKVSEQII